MDVTETAYLYQGFSTNVHKEYSVSGSPYAEYYMGANNQLVSRKMFGNHGLSNPSHDPNLKTTGGMLYYQYDGLNTVSSVTDRHGDIIENYRYDAFGGIQTGITAPYNHNAYTSQRYDDKAGLIDMNARWYDPTVGRFLTQDTYRGDHMNPLTLNRYSYVLNNPVNMWDPTGNMAEYIVDGGGGSTPISNIPQWVLDKELVHEVRSNVTPDGFLGEYWAFRGYDKYYTSETRSTQTVDESFKFITISFEKDVREVWNYEYSKILVGDLGDGEYYPKHYYVNNEPVTFIRDGVEYWSDIVSARTIAEDIQKIIAANHTPPENTNYRVKSTWAVGATESIFFGNGNNSIIDQSIAGAYGSSYSLNQYAYGYLGTTPPIGSSQFGTAAHKVIQSYFMSKYPTQGDIEYEVPVPGNKSGKGYIDIVLFGSNVVEVYEIKPISHKPGSIYTETDKQQMQQYIQGLKSEGEIARAGTSWNPDQKVLEHPFNPNKELVLETDYLKAPGFIYYYERNKKNKKPNPVTVPVVEKSPQEQNDPVISGEDVATGAVVVTGGYIIYRGIRMIPSLFPPLWGTIPANIAIP